MTEQARHKLSALLYAAVPLAAATAADLGVEADTWTKILAAVVAFAAVFGVNVATGDRTAAVGGDKAATK